MSFPNRTLLVSLVAVNGVTFSSRLRRLEASDLCLDVEAHERSAEAEAAPRGEPEDWGWLAIRPTPTASTPHVEVVLAPVEATFDA